MPTSNLDPLCYPYKHAYKHTPPQPLPPQFTVPTHGADEGLQPHFRPLVFPPRSPPDRQSTLIIPFPIINPCCFHTMGPKKPFRPQRKHLLLSRQGTNSRILEAVSYIPSLKLTHTQMYRRLLPPPLPLHICFPICTIT